MDRYYSTFKYHVVIAIIACTIVTVGIFATFSVFDEKNSIPLTQLNLPKYDYITSYKDGLIAQYAMERSLTTGDIVIFGSSELGYPGEEVPYRFFKDKINKNVLAFGMAGTQSLTVLAQLSAYYSQEMLDNARIVIIVSPGWFDTDGTDIYAFRNTMPASLMMRLLYESNAPYQYKKYLQEYIANNFDELSLPKPIDFAWKYAFPRKEAKIKYLNRFYSYLAKFTEYYPYKVYDGYLKSKLVLNSVEDSAPKNIQKFNWESLFKDAITLQTSKSNNNQYGINDEYFTTHVRKRIKNGKFPIKSPIVSSYSKEYRDFILLAEFCKMFKHKPLFIMLPFNEKAYTDLENYQPVIDKVEDALKLNNLPFLNMWKDGDKPGMLADIMHTGAYGWQRINHALYKRFVEE